MNINQLSKELREELSGNILQFWAVKMLDPRGGFYARMRGDGSIDENAPKGGVLNARILWTFSAASRVIGYDIAMADRAYQYIVDHFIDKEYGGTYWSVDSKGHPLDTKKQFYSIAFTIYALSEYYRVSGCEDALEYAKQLYYDIENHSFEAQYGGYIEACTRDWKPIEDMRLSDKDRNDAKTMNTHLHILEAYTNLYRVWPDSELELKLKALIDLFFDKIVRGDGHLGLFFNEKWDLQSSVQSFGHDIECSWLIQEAIALMVDKCDSRDDNSTPHDDETTQNEMFRNDGKAMYNYEVQKIAKAALEGWSANGGMIYEYDPDSGEADKDRHWWVQAENVVGAIYQYRLTNDEEWLKIAFNQWEFIKNHLIRPEGEWYWSIKEDGSINNYDDIAGFWKCPYHNGRMCLSLIEELN